MTKGLGTEITVPDMHLSDRRISGINSVVRNSDIGLRETDLKRCSLGPFGTKVENQLQGRCAVVVIY